MLDNFRKKKNSFIFLRVPEDVEKFENIKTKDPTEKPEEFGSIKIYIYALNEEKKPFFFFNFKAVFST